MWVVDTLDLQPIASTKALMHSSTGFPCRSELVVGVRADRHRHYSPGARFTWLKTRHLQGSRRVVAVPALENSITSVELRLPMPATQSRPRSDGSSSSKVKAPVLRVTLFDRLSSGMIAFVMGLTLGVAMIIVYWATTRPERHDFLVPMEMVELSGGSEDGAPDETLKVESPEDPTENPSEDVLQDVQLTEVVENVVELANQATRQAEQVQVTDASGSPGSADGTGRRALGSGPGAGGIPNEQRWFIQYSDQAGLNEYAQQLQHFGIELGALLPSGQLIYLSNLTNPKPTTRTSTSGKTEDRLYMTWQGGSRKQADEQLFNRAGVDASNAILFHFYPKSTEQQLLTLEFQYAKRKASEIRRTYFVVIKQGAGYNFVVTRQVYLR